MLSVPRKDKQAVRPALFFCLFRLFLRDKLAEQLLTLKRLAAKIGLQGDAGKPLRGAQGVGIGKLSLAQGAQLAAGKAALIDHQAGNKSPLFAVAVRHVIADRLAATGAVQEIDAITQVTEQRQFKTSQCRFRLAVR